MGRNMTPVAAALLAGLLAATTSRAEPVRGEIEKESYGWVERIDHVVAVPAGGRLVFETDRGGIDVESEEREGVRLVIDKVADVYTEEEARRALEDFTVDVRRKGDEVTVVAESRSDRSARYLELDVRLIVPRPFDIDVRTGGGGIDIGDMVGNVTARTSGGGIDVGRVRDGSVDVQTSGGGIDIGGIDNGNGRAETSGGGIEVGNVSGNLKVNTSGGGLDIGRVGGELIAETSGGGIDIAYGGTVYARTGGGGIEVAGSAGRVDVKTSGGGIDIARAGGAVEAVTSGGGIDIDGAAGPVLARTSGGGIDLRDVAGSVEARTSGGGIRADLTGPRTAGEEVLLESGGGSIELSLPKGVKAEIDAEIRLQGARRRYRIASDFDLIIDEGGSRITGRGKLNGGGGEVRLRTTNGDIEIRKD